MLKEIWGSHHCSLPLVWVSPVERASDKPAYTRISIQNERFLRCALFGMDRVPQGPLVLCHAGMAIPRLLRLDALGVCRTAHLARGQILPENNYFSEF